MFHFFTKSRQPITFCFSTDIHAHIIPGIDDGAPDAETSLKLIDAMHHMGIDTIFASPHIAEGAFENTRTSITTAYETLMAALNRTGRTDVAIKCHAENRIDNMLLENISRGAVPTLPDGYALIENSFIQEPWNLEQLIFDMQVKGYRPILAHPERFSYYDMRRLKKLHERIPFQINMLSFAGYYGKDICRKAVMLAREGFADFLGTDIHSMRHIDCLQRYLTTADAKRHRAILEPIVRNDFFNI